MKRDIKIGDIVEVVWGGEINWVNEPTEVVVLDIKELGDDWIAAVINGVYRRNDGSESSEILLSSLIVDVKASRDKNISRILEEE